MSLWIQSEHSKGGLDLWYSMSVSQVPENMSQTYL